MYIVLVVLAVASLIDFDQVIAAAMLSLSLLAEMQAGTVRALHSTPSFLGELDTPLLWISVASPVQSILCEKMCKAYR